MWRGVYEAVLFDLVLDGGSERGFIQGLVFGVDPSYSLPAAHMNVIRVDF